MIVAELGRMMEVDRCDVIKLTPEGELRVSHEWRATETVPSSLDARIPVDVKTLSQYLDVRQPIKLDDTSAPELDHKVRFFAKSLGTRSLLVVPVVLDDEVVGLIGLHHTRSTRHWSDEEVAFLVSIATQLADRLSVHPHLHRQETGSRDDPGTAGNCQCAQCPFGFRRSDFRRARTRVVAGGARITVRWAFWTPTNIASAWRLSKLRRMRSPTTSVD